MNLLFTLDRIIYHEENEPYIDFMIYDAIQGEKEIHYRVRLDELSYTFEHIGKNEFLDSTTYFIKHEYANLLLRYTFEDREPNAQDPSMDQPIIIDQTATMSYALFDNEGKAFSKTRTVMFEQLTPFDAVHLNPGSLQNGLAYSYAEGAWKSVPDFDKILIQKTGISSMPSIEAIETRDDHYALEWKGYIYLHEEALYEWQTTSDDGSKLYLHNQLIVDNDGSHSKRMRSGLIALKKGWHSIRILYFEDYAGQFLELGYRLPNHSNWQKVSPEQFKTAQ
jgi:hypothetical protein